MAVAAFLLLAISLTKLFIASGEHKLELRKLISGIPVHEDLIDPITKSILVFDGLLGLICGLIIISL